MSSNETDTPNVAAPDEGEEDGTTLAPHEPDATPAPVEAPPEGDDVPAHEEDDDEPTDAVDVAEWFKHELPPGLTAHEFAMFPACPLCEGFGRVPGDVPPDPHSTPCDDCRGYGVVYTGSKVPGHEQRTCVTCDGSGYIAERVQQFAFPAEPIPVAPVPIAAPSDPPWEGAQWDSARGIWRDQSDLIATRP